MAPALTFVLFLSASCAVALQDESSAPCPSGKCDKEVRVVTDMHDHSLLQTRALFKKAELDDEENDEEEGGRDILWQQWGSDNDRCSEVNSFGRQTTAATKVGNQSECQQLAIDANHEYYEYEEVSSYCNTCATGGPTSSRILRSPWKIYHEALWDQYDRDNERCGKGCDTKVQSQSACQQLAIGGLTTPAHNYYEYDADRGCCNTCSTGGPIKTARWNNWKTYTAPYTCPDGWVRVGGLGANVPGCGLNCDSVLTPRLGMATINECAQKAFILKSCCGGKSFTWAPIGADSSNPDTTVCTIYSYDDPKSVWGSEQIMCKPS